MALVRTIGLFYRAYTKRPKPNVKTKAPYQKVSLIEAAINARKKLDRDSFMIWQVFMIYSTRHEEPSDLFGKLSELVRQSL